MPLEDKDQAVLRSAPRLAYRMISLDKSIEPCAAANHPCERIRPTGNTCLGQREFASHGQPAARVAGYVQ